LTAQLHILGAGALGTLFAHRAIVVGYEPVLVTRVPEVTHQADMTRQPEKQRVITLEDGDNRMTHAFATEAANANRPITHLFIATKSYDVLSAIDSVINRFTRDTRVAVISNGLGYHEAVNQRIPSHRLVAATTTAGCKLLSSSASEDQLTQRYGVAGAGVTLFGAWRTPPPAGSPAIPSWLMPFIDGPWPCGWRDDIHTALLMKLAVNAVINPCTALNDVANGALAESPWRGQVEQATREVTQILEAAKQAHVADTLASTIDTVIADTAHNTSSMLADIRAKRPTEHEAILGYLLEQLGPATDAPLLTSWLLLLRQRSRNLVF
jgi:2-dehydropantoate 2-reductase